jgi:hypothetical protein
VHDNGETTQPFSGYIDSRDESSDGSSLDRGIDFVVLRFSESVRDLGTGPGGGLTEDSFVVSSSGAAPSVIHVEDSKNPLVILELSGPIAVGAWTTIRANVEDLAGNVIASEGDLGPDMDEPDRVDIGFLPCDVDQNGDVEALDLLRFRQMYTGRFENPVGDAEDYIDIDRSGLIQPLDLLRFRQLFRGTGSATQAWNGVTLSDRP